jgi:quinol monooxygenase YgiN
MAETKEGPMILEIAQIDIKEGCAAEFEAAVRQAHPIFKRAKGCAAFALERSIETPLRYRLLVRWNTLENHIVDFQKSSDFLEWRKLVKNCFAAIPEVEHTRSVMTFEF